MEIKLTEISIKDLFNGYENNDELGVKAFGGKLDIRPPYQREFIYDQTQQREVIKTVSKNFPLNVMYWATREDGTFEVIDGQQRTMSICEYLEGNFSVDFRNDNNPVTFGGLQSDKQKAILDYKLTVYVCTGTDSEKLDWFETINIAGEKLTRQELRNAVYSGQFVTEAKKKFSKTNCVAYKLGNKYLQGSCIRQDYLETVISWINDGRVSEYMSTHQHDANADELWTYFQNIIGWVQKNFTKYRAEMKKVQWGVLYNKHKGDELTPAELEKRVAELMKDSDIQKKSGIYAYVLDGDERHLGIRIFDDNTKREVYEMQKGICKICGKHFEIEQMEADHIKPWCQGGHTVKENCQMLCRDCNRKKSGK